VDELIEPDDEAENDDTPEETKATFWGQIGDFIGTMLLGLP
jgi:hypothetical protein